MRRTRMAAQCGRMPAFSKLYLHSGPSDIAISSNHAPFPTLAAEGRAGWRIPDHDGEHWDRSPEIRHREDVYAKLAHKPAAWQDGQT